MECVLMYDYAGGHPLEPIECVFMYGNPLGGMKCGELRSSGALSH